MASDGKYSLQKVMEELEKLKPNQQRYEEQYVQSKLAGAASSFVAGDIQLQNLKKLAEDIERIEKILRKVNRTTREIEKKLDDLKQYGCRICLILHGCRNAPTEESYINFETFVVNKLNNKITRSNHLTLMHAILFLPGKKNRKTQSSSNL